MRSRSSNPSIFSGADGCTFPSSTCDSLDHTRMARLSVLLAALGAASAAPSLRLSANKISTDTWISVSFDGLTTGQIESGSGDYICGDDQLCRNIISVNAWVGVFQVGADVSQIGPQDWGTGTPPWIATSPIKWKPVNQTSGKLDFYMQTPLDHVQFMLFVNGTTWPQLAARSEVLEFSDVGQPQGLRLARTRDAAEMRVSWQSSRGGPGAVQFGLESGSLNQTIAASNYTYSRSDLCGPPASAHGWIEPGWFFTAVMAGLPAGAKVFYRVGSDAGGWSAEFNFSVAEGPNRDATLRVAAIADMGETYEDGSQYHWNEPYAINTTNFVTSPWTGSSHTLPRGLRRLALNPKNKSGTISGKEGRASGHVVQRLSERTEDKYPDVLVHVGDVSYATGYESEWLRFGRQIEPIAARVPWMVGLGNHERDFPGSGSNFTGEDSGGECGVATLARFPMPYANAEDPRGLGAWYSFEQGPVHFVMLDTEMAIAPGSSQFAWLEADLTAVDRAVTPWVILMGHRPMYTGNIIDPHFSTIEPLLFDKKVDLCLWGHVHNAQVTCPVFQGKCTQGAPIHAVIGNAGQSLTKFPEPKAPWSVYQGMEFGYSAIEVQGASLLTMRFFANIGNELHYTFNITK